jgi:hypothetical protein
MTNCHFGPQIYGSAIIFKMENAVHLYGGNKTAAKPVAEKFHFIF